MAGVEMSDTQIANFLAKNPDAKATPLDAKGAPAGDEEALSNFIANGNSAVPAPPAGTVEADGTVTPPAPVEVKAAAEEAAAAEKKTAQMAPLVTAGAIAENAIAPVSDGLARAADWMASRPTPGGIGALLAGILFLVWVLVPTSSGQTRMFLLWSTITGRTKLVGARVFNTATGVGAAGPQPASPVSSAPGGTSTGGAFPAPSVVPGMQTYVPFDTGMNGTF